MSITRKVMESNVTGYNSPLRERVKKMNIVTLLRHVHPRDRQFYTYAALKEKLITREQAKEFVKFVGHETTKAN